MRSCKTSNPMIICIFYETSSKFVVKICFMKCKLKYFFNICIENFFPCMFVMNKVANSSTSVGIGHMCRKVTFPHALCNSPACLCSRGKNVCVVCGAKHSTTTCGIWMELSLDLVETEQIFTEHQTT